MTPSVFSKGIAELALVYGEKNYPKIRVDSIWQIVRDLSDESFKNFCAKWVLDKKAPPLGAEFRELATSEGIGKREDSFLKTPCARCYGEGYVEAESLLDKCVRLFVCNCSNGFNSHWNLPKKTKDEVIKIRRWDSALAMEYKIIYQKEPKFIQKTKWPRFVELMIWSLDENKYEIGAARVVKNILGINTEELDSLASAYVNQNYNSESALSVIKKTKRFDSDSTMEQILKFAHGDRGIA
jgi:hypothetical protein